MARKGLTHEDNVHCSECGSIIEAEATACEHCGESLDDEFKAMVCPYCGTVLESDSKECFNCGLKFQASRDVTNLRSEEDQEFLSRLLKWGQTHEKEGHVPTEEDKEEEESAEEVFKTVLGSQEATPMVEESIKEIQKTAEEVSEFEKREESILKLASPLQTALKARWASLDKAEQEINAIRAEISQINDNNDPEAVQKRAELERRMAEISMERDAIHQLEDNIMNMDQTYRRLLEKHQEELIDKENKFNLRLESFKSEMTRREQEKERMKAREEFLKKKEKELEDRINSLKDREKGLKKAEEEMRKTILSLQEERDGLAEIKEQAHSIIAGEGVWMIEAKELKSIMKKNKKVRAEWMKTQVEIQDKLKRGRKVEDVDKEISEEFAIKEEELNSKIAELENKLSTVEGEEAVLSEEEKKLVDLHEDIKKVLKEVDDLLGHLPDELIDEFAKSKKFKIYEKVMDELGL